MFSYVVADKEIKVEEEWVQNECNNKFVQHVINIKKPIIVLTFQKISIFEL